MYRRLYLAKTDGEFEMNIKETLVFENELNTLFNQEETMRKTHYKLYVFGNKCC